MLQVISRIGFTLHMRNIVMWKCFLPQTVDSIFELGYVLSNRKYTESFAVADTLDTL